jgi:hypothetical protein
MSRLIVLLIASVFFAPRASAQESITAGAGLTAGLLGAEVLWRPGGGLFRIGTGAGVAGFGARAVLPVGVSDGPGWEAPTRTRYLSAGYLLTPWEIGNIDATGAFVGEVGLQILHAGQRLLADVAVGAAVIHGGSWGGYAAAPALRLQLGVRLGMPGSETRARESR